MFKGLGKHLAAFIGKKDSKEALEWLEKGIEAYVEPKLISRYEGEHETKELDQVNKYVIECYDRALILDPSLAEVVYFRKGVVYRQHKMYSKAVEFFRKVLTIRSNDGATWNELGRCYASLETKNEEAYECFKKAAELNPNEGMTWNNLANILSRMGRYEQAIQFYQKSMELLLASEMKNLPRIGLANAQVKLKEKQKAMKELFTFTKSASIDMEAIKENEKNFPTRWIWKQVKNPEEFRLRNNALQSSMVGKLIETIEYCNAGIKLNPRSPYLLYLRGRTYGDTGNFDKGLKDLNQVIADNPTFADAYIERGYIKHKIGKLSEAELDYKVAKKLEPGIQIPEQ